MRRKTRSRRHDLEANLAGALSDGIRRAEEPSRLRITISPAGQSGKALEEIGHTEVCLDRHTG
jgi:hypothetical protein